MSLILLHLIEEAVDFWSSYVDYCNLNQIELSFTFEQFLASFLLANGVNVRSNNN